jgi:hypothetical protein
MGDNGSLIIGVTITVIALALIVGVVVMLLTFGRKLVYPRGFTVFRETPGGIPIRVVFETTRVPASGTHVRDEDGNLFNIEDLVEIMAQAVDVAVTEYRSSGLGHRIPAELVIHVTASENFRRLYYDPSTVAALTTTVATQWNIGNGPFLIAIQEKTLNKGVITRGQPVIHEMMHVLLRKNGMDYDGLHSRERVWRTHGPNTVERVAQNRMSLLLTTPGEKEE